MYSVLSVFEQSKRVVISVYSVLSVFEPKIFMEFVRFVFEPKISVLCEICGDFALLGPFFDTIQNGGVLIIDEFGTSLHTQLSVELLKLFYSTMNAHGAQLIITTHDTNLLRKDLLTYSGAYPFRIPGL